ncbi:hypothetical protein BC828DRAFT_112440 [Blastocladiella britannica]|nr:hypothetical protein BC828DRAFT_112440 [Blastocladiella britannica]
MTIPARYRFSASVASSAGWLAACSTNWANGIDSISTSFLPSLCVISSAGTLPLGFTSLYLQFQPIRQLHFEKKKKCANASNQKDAPGRLVGKVNVHELDVAIVRLALGNVGDQPSLVQCNAHALRVRALGGHVELEGQVGDGAAHCVSYFFFLFFKRIKG